MFSYISYRAYCWRSNRRARRLLKAALGNPADWERGPDLHSEDFVYSVTYTSRLTGAQITGERSRLCAGDDIGRTLTFSSGKDGDAQEVPKHCRAMVLKFRAQIEVARKRRKEAQKADAFDLVVADAAERAVYAANPPLLPKPTR